jgi:metallophosphoesterase (TIGR03767 family)
MDKLKNTYCGNHYKNTCCHKIKKNATTLDVTIVPQPDPNLGTTGAYFKLEYGEGDCVLIREDLAFANERRKKKRVPLASFIQITDVHIIDSSSPARAAFLAQYIPEVEELQDTFRPNEALSLQVADAMVRKINNIKRGPHTNCDIEFVISCGDNGDGQQKNELQNYINVLDGRTVYPNTATPGKYIGVQDNTPTVNFRQFYHPDVQNNPNLEDIYKVQYGFPSYNNILNEAAKPFKPTGLNYPWYTTNGNHDGTKLGGYGLNLYSMFQLFDQIATGNIPGKGSKLIQAMNPALAKQFIVELQKQNTAGVLDIINKSVLRDIPASDKRVQYTRDDFIAMHFNTDIFPGPVGHGFCEDNRINSTLYYEFKVSKYIDGFVLDTCNPSGNLEDVGLAADGSIGRKQLSWLESELIKRHSTYLDTQGHLVRTDNPNRLCILFSHHDHNTMNNIFNSLDVVDPDPQKVPGSGFIQFVQRFPNVILWVNGHEHRNIVTPMRVPASQQNRYESYNKHTNNNNSDSKECEEYEYTGFWEINTASHIDFPQQSRIIEVSDNMDGTLSIFGTLIDHLSPPDVDHHGDCYTLTEMASISRELSYNDPFNDPRTRGGTPEDRNVELIINNPLLRDW